MMMHQKVLLGVGTAAVVGAAVLSGTMNTMNYTAGTYVGTAQGFGGNVTAVVTVDAEGIAAVELSGAGETPDLGGKVLKELAPKFAEANSVQVDSISGCTITSDAAKEAVQQALDQAAGKIPVIEAEETTEAAKEETAEETTEEAAETAEEIGDYTSDGGLRTGLATLHSMAKSKDAGDQDGTAQVDSTVVAVIIDQEGRVVDCKLDIAQTIMSFTADGKAIMQDDFQTKRELGDGYGMRSASGIGKEWYEQADAFEEYVIGKTAKEIAGIAVDEATKPVDADLASGVTVSIGGYQQAVVKAIQNAEEIGTQEGDKLGLAIVTDMHKSKDATVEGDGQCQAYSTYMAVTVNDEGIITGSLIDASQGTVTFDQTGKITSDIKAGVKTKRELGDSYGMKSASSIGKEWYEQADVFEEYMVGKTADEVAGIAVTEENVLEDADLASGVTISIGAFQEAAVKAAENAK